ncbi:NAD(P)-dependent alcohol dehydrogenase [Cypionkella sp.]|uniref:NAD(P)-dependent alcohol dehydrogenase n=1 Tax=Cypionkella sp. TaxID=2811411 RepID=UPI002ABB3CA0|nr:NAD(P)-dependent alcohol dehydrogenase [Cypionkella sp.]MDZ4393997.1 NAD(P)-dependent alcohol dehydrogenase [Cypionkella sp.]
MKAAVLRAYGGPENIQITDLPEPIPKPGQVLVRLQATTVNSGDARVRALDVPAGMALPFRLAMGWHRPRQPILGTEGAGVVVACGEGADRFRVGQAVVVFPGGRMGSHAELITMPQDGKIIAKPATLSMQEAACMMFGGLTAVDFLRRKAGLREGEHVLITGATGTVGSAAVQIAGILGAVVTGVASAGNLATLKDLGAETCIDYRLGPIALPLRPYDVILDCAGTLPYPQAKRLLAPGGRLIRVWAELAEMITAPLIGRRAGHRVIAGVSAEKREDMLTLAEWAEAGLYRPLIDSVTPFADIAKAHRLASTGHKRGSAVVEFAVPQTPA